MADTKRNLTLALEGEDRPTIEGIIRALNLTELDIGQEVIDVSASRTTDVTYSNSTGRPITVIIQTADAALDLSLYINTARVAVIYQSASGIQQVTTIVVPNGDTYKLTSVAGSFTRWSEIR